MNILKIESLNPSIKLEFCGFNDIEIRSMLEAISKWEKVRTGTSINPLIDEGKPVPASTVKFTGEDIHGQGGSYISSFLPDVDGKNE